MFDFSHDAEAALIVRQLDELGMGDIPHVGPNALAQSQTYDLCDAKQLKAPMRPRISTQTNQCSHEEVPG